MARDLIAVIPVAGVGTRLRPHTYTQPKVLLNVAGKPILAHILDELPEIGVEEVVLVVGYMEDRVREYVDRAYPSLRVHYAQQTEHLGLGHAVSLAAGKADDRPTLVILGDTIFEADLASVVKGKSHSVGVKAVEDPRRFGIVEVNGNGQVTRMVEKPEHPTSNLALTGIYFFPRGGPLFAALEELQQRNVRTRGEFQLTDAMQLMVEKGDVFTTFPVEGWYDCGKTETLLETNRILLARAAEPRAIEGSVVHAPISVAEDAVVENCILGPYASIGAGARIKNAAVRDSIVNENALVENILIEGSVVGESAIVRGAWKRVNIGTSSELELG